jgi:hypothetical protein
MLSGVVLAVGTSGTGGLVMAAPPTTATTPVGLTLVDDGVPSFTPGAFTPAEPQWDGASGVQDIGDPRLRLLVADIADLAEEPERRTAAAAALTAGTAAAIEQYLFVGDDQAMAVADARKKQTAKDNKAAVTKMAGTGGTYFNKAVQDALKGTDADRAAFLAYGAAVARTRDEKVTADAAARAEQLRARVQMLAGLADSEVSRAAKVALTGGDTAIAAFIDGGYLTAATKDAQQREELEKQRRAQIEAAEKLSDLAQKAARASEARQRLIVAHGDAVRALRRAANAMISADNEARRAAQILAANTVSGNHPPTAYDQVKAEAARQLGYAQQAAAQATQAAVRADVEARILIETGLEYGSEWALVAAGMKEAADAAVAATQTGVHAIDATAATGAARNAEEKAKAHEEQAKKWRLYSEAHAAAAAKLAVTAKKQADTAALAAQRTKQARIEAEAADARAQAAAEKVRQQRVIAEQEADKAAAARAVAERERALAAQYRATAEQQAALARSARGQAESLASVASTARKNAEAQEGISEGAKNRAATAENDAIAARDRALEFERQQRAAEARAAAFEAAAAQERGGPEAGIAQAAADQARTEANTAKTAAHGARGAANQATGAAANARAAATEATRAAARARAAAEQAAAAAARANAAAAKAERLAAETHRQATIANAAAAEATEQEVKAAEAAAGAVRSAQQAADEAAQALLSAKRVESEAGAAAGEAVNAAAQAEASIRASAAAKDAAAGIADPANTAIRLVAPFTATDLDAAYAAEVAQLAQRLGAEQVAAAQARADEAVVAAQNAQAAADRAAAEVRPAYQAAAAAANSAAAAARSAADAQRSAAAAAAEAAKAREAAVRANEADIRAQKDAIAARQAANRASNDAAIAGRAASAAEADAAAARGAASRAEADAAAARSAADRAEADAAAADTAAKNAQKNADAALESSKNAMAAAVAAQEAAERAEAADREKERQENKESVNSGPTESPELNAEDNAFIQGMCIGDTDPEACEAQMAKDLAAAKNGIFEFLKENGAEIIIELIGWDDIRACFTEGDVEACLWTVAGMIPWTKLGPVAKAFIKVASKIADYLKASKKVQKSIQQLKKLLEMGKKACKDLSTVPVQPVAFRTSSGKTIAYTLAAADPDDEFAFECKPGMSVGSYTAKLVPKLAAICKRLGHAKVSDCGHAFWGGPAHLDPNNIDAKTFDDAVAKAIAAGMTKSDADWMAKYFDMVDKVSSQCGCNRSPAAGGRAAILRKILERLPR